MARQRFARRARRRYRRSSRRMYARRAGKTIPIAQTAAGLFGVLTIAQPYFQGSTMGALKSGNISSLPGAFVNDSKSALTAGKLIEAATPFVVIALSAKALRMFGVSSPRVGKLRVF